MNIIKSRYESNYLNELIKEGESKIETNILKKIERQEKIPAFALTIGLTVAFAVYLFGKALRGPVLLSVVVGVIFFVFFSYFCLQFNLIAGDSIFARRYRKKGHILSNPYDEDFQEFARLIEVGEQLHDLLSNDDNFVVTENRYAIVCSKKGLKTLTFDLGEYYYEDVVKEDCLDFSVFDEDIEKYEKGENKYDTCN